MNVEKENPAPPASGNGVNENFSDDTGTLSDTQTACKKQFPDWPADVAAPKPLRGDSKKDGIDAPPAGFGFENDQLVPFAPDESDEEITSERLEFYRVHTALWRWALGDERSAKVAAVWHVLRQDQRTPEEIAVELKRTPELVRLRIREAKKLLGELRREARP